MPFSWRAVALAMGPGALSSIPFGKTFRRPCGGPGPGAASDWSRHPVVSGSAGPGRTGETSHCVAGRTLDLTTLGRPPTDEELIRCLQAGDEAALEYLVATYWHRLCRFVNGILVKEGGEEDVVQEAFVRLWMRRRKLRLEGSFKAFLFTLARNAAIDERRRSGRREALASSLDPPPPSPSPLAEAEASELKVLADAAVAALPPRRREIFQLARVEGLTYREIAEVLGLSQQTVANQMSRALTSLHKTLAPLLGRGGSEGTGPGPPTAQEV